MERADTGLGRDAYGSPRRARDRRGYGPGPYPPDEGYPAEEDDAAGSGRRPEAEEGDYGQPLRRPGEMPPRQPRMRQPGRPQPGQPARFPPGAPPNGSPGHGEMPGGGIHGGTPGGGIPGGGRHRLTNGRPIPPGADRAYRPPGPGTAAQGSHVAGGPGPGGAGPRGPDARPAHGAPPEPPGPVIRQRDTARPEDQPGAPSQPVASIAPDDLEAFARDLRALRAKAHLDYPEMAETSHFEMKTLAAAAGGLRLPTLPVAVAFVRACGGNVAEWEERWQKIAGKLTAEAANKRRGDAEETAEPVAPTEAPAAPEPSRPAASPPEPDGGEVYVITSAPPRQPDW